MKHWLLSLFCLGLLFGQNPETAVFPGAVVTDETLLVAKDSAWSTLNGDINDSTLTVEVWDGGRFAYPSVVKIDNEFLKVCSIATSTMTICSGGRGFAGTTPASHGSGALVEDVVTAKHHNLPMAEIKAIQTALGAGFAKSGDTSTVVTTTGAQTSGRCVEIDANGNHIQAAAECGGGGGASASRDLTDLKVAVGSGTQLDFAAGAFGDHDESFALTAGYFTIQSRSVSDIGENTTTTITTSAALGVGFHNGDSVNVAGVAGTGCSTLNALHVITVTGASTFTVPINTTGLTCTGGTVAGTGNGTAYVYGRDDGEILVEVPASSGVIATCGSGSCVVNQVTTPSHALGIAPLATVTIAAGAWGTATDARAFLGKRPLVAGTGIEVLGDLVSIDPATVPQLGGTNAWTGANDFGDAASLELPNGAGPTVDAAGKVAVDTTTDQLQFYGGAKRALPSILHASFVIIAPVATDDYPLMKAPYGMTILSVNGVLLGSTNVVGQLQECDSAGANCADTDSDITFDGGNDADDGTLSNPSIDAGDWIAWKTTSVSGTPTSLTVTFTYRVVPD